MPSDDIPGWCRQGIGTGPLLVIAPHGGRRQSTGPTDEAAGKVNDLHTADLAHELAAVLEASFVINGGCDRNHIDLNRISQVRARAPWFLRLLEARLDEALCHHARVEVLVLHGWNITQPKCDVGVGRRFATPDQAAAHAAELTVSPGYAAGRLAALRDACARLGIEVPFGERYPAQHPNNVLQLFRRAPRQRPAAPRLAAWAAAGRIEAVQLELGVPLRWPGPLRTAFLDALRGVFASDPSRAGPRGPTEPVRQPRRASGSPPAAAAGAPGTAIQCYDPAVELGVVARVDPGPDGRIGARVLLFAGPRRVGLFTGEERDGARLCGGGPHVDQEPDGFRLSFAGHILVTDDGERYVDLERAFAASTLSALHLELRFRAGPTPELGTVTGTVELDGASHALHALGFARPALQQPRGGMWHSHLSLAAAFGPERALRVRHEFPGAGLSAEDVTAHGRTARSVGTPALYFDRRRCAPTRLTLGDIVAEPITHLAIVRPAGPRRRAQVSYGIARVSDGPARGYGFYEYARVL